MGKPIYAMSFDQSSNLPLIQPKKNTTKVNFGIVAGVLVFLALTISVVVWYANNPHQPVADEHEARQSAPAP